MNRIIFALMIATALLMSMRPAAQDRSDVALRAAMETETVKGDLKGAIEQYRGIAGQTHDRSIAATALMRMAECYRKLGDAQASSIYERIIREFADQKEAAATARERLMRATDATIPRLTMRQLWEVPPNAVGGPDGLGTVSPDGRYFSFVDWSTGNLLLHDFKTGQDRRLTTSGARGQYAEESVISHDGMQIAYAWFNNDGYDIRLLDLSGKTPPRVLFANHQEDPWVFPYDWSPDGKWVAVQIRRADGTGQLALISILDGTRRVLESSDWRRASAMAFSADGKYLAYDIAADTVPEQHDIYLLATDAHQKNAAVVNPANDTVIGWTPDGSRLLFASDRSGSNGIWSLSVADGKSNGEPQLIKADVRLEPRGITRSGALYFSTSLSRQDIYLSSLDFATGKLLSAPVRIAGQTVGFNVAPQWSPDGAALAYLPRNKDASTLAIQTIATGEVRELRPNLAYIFDEPPLWSHDGSFLLVVGPDQKGRWGIHRVDARTGETTPVVQSDPPANNGVHPLGWSPDGQTLYIRRRLAPPLNQTVAFDMRTRDERLLRQVTTMPSPNGRAWVAIDRSSNGTTLRLETKDAAAAHTLLHVDAPEDLQNPAWSPDSTHVIVQRISSSRREFWVTPIDGSPQKLDFGGLVAANVQLHPDGHRIAVLTDEPKVTNLGHGESAPTTTGRAVIPMRPTMNRFMLALMTAAALLMPMHPAAQDQSDVALRAAMETETVKGDLKGAIEQYRRIVSETHNRAVAATALVRMADCYQRLGDAQARRIYERVVQEYADQKDIAALARTRLGSGVAAAGVVARELWPGDGSGGEASLAPDGRSVVTLTRDDRVGTVDVIRDLVTGAHTTLPTAGGFGEWPILSPDSSEIAYGWCCQDGVYELRIAKAKPGANSRVVLHNPEVAYYLLENWSPDGKSILSIISTAGNAAQLVWISVADGSVQTLKSVDWRGLGSAQLSPDGQFIAYDAFVRRDSPDREIRIMNADGSRESVIVPAFGNNASPVWTRDGLRVVFVSDRAGTPGLWSVAVQDGKANGPTELVRPNMAGVRPVGFSSAGPFLYVQEVGNQNVFVQALDPVTGKVEGDSARLVDTYVGANTNPSWSPDGKTVAYISRRTEPANDTSPATLVIRSVDTGQETAIPTTFTYPGQPMWLPDGRTIVQPARNNQNNTSLYSVDVRTGTVHELVNTGAGLPPGAALAPSGATAYVRDPEKVNAIAAFDLASSRRMEVRGAAVEGPFLTLAVSPDGKHLAYPAKGSEALHLYVANIDGSDPHDLFGDRPQNGFVTGLAWTADSQWIYFVLSDGASLRGHGSQLWRIAAKGGTPQYTGRAASTMGAISLNREGTRLVFGAGELSLSEYWMLENLQRTWKTSRK